MSPKSRLRSLKARFKRILSDRERDGNHDFKDSASSSSSAKKKLSSPSRFKKKTSSSSSSSVNSNMKKLPSPVRTDVSSSSSSSDNIEGSPSQMKRKKKKRSSSSSESPSDSQGRLPSKSIKKLQLIGLESRLKLALHETSQVSPSSKIFVSDSKLLSEKDRDQRGSHRDLLSTTLSPTTSNEASSPALPRYSFSLNDSSASSSPGRVGRIKVPEELFASQSSYDQTYALLGKPEGNSNVQSKISSPKVKRIQSAFLDEKRGVWRCRNCNWTYPNPNPSARHRRDHKKHCGEMLNVQQWLKVIVSDEQDVQGSIKEEEGRLHAVSQLATEGSKAPLPSSEDEGGTVREALFDSKRAVESEEMTVQEPENEIEIVGEVDQVETEPLDIEDVTEVNTTGNRDDTSEISPRREDVSERHSESGDVDFPRLETSNYAVVLSEADNDTEGHGTEADVGTVNSANVDLDDVGVSNMEEQRNAREEELKELQDAEAVDDTDASGTEGPGELDLGTHAEANYGMRTREENEIGKNDAGQEETFFTDGKGSESDPTAENSELVEVGEREVSHKEDEGDKKIEEEADFGTAALVAREDLDNVKGDFESENESGIKERISALGNDHDIALLDSGNAPVSHVMVGNHGNGSHKVSDGLKPYYDIDTEDQAHDKLYIDLGADDNNGDKRQFGVDSSLKEDSSPTSLLVGRRSASSPSSSSSSSRSSSVGDDSDKFTPRKINQDMSPPVPRYQDPHVTVEIIPWRSRNAVQDEILESNIDEAGPSTTWKRHQDDVPETDEGTMTVIASTMTTETTWQSPPETTVTRISIPNEVGTVGSAIKKEIFKNRQTFWAEITSSDILEGNRHSPSTISPSADPRTPAHVDAVHSPSNNVATYQSRQDSSDKVIQSESVRTEISTSNFHLEASTSEFRPVSVASSSNADSVDEYDLERVIHEQKTHDIMCPVCGSCITKRVILRKRKRYLPSEDPKRPRLPVPPAPVPKDSEGWGCLACFSIFFPKAVSRTKNEPKDEKEGSSCLQIAFPTFPWGSKERLTDPGLLPPDNNTVEPGTYERELPFTVSPFPLSSGNGSWFSNLKWFSRSSAPGGPQSDDFGASPRELPTSSSPHAADSQSAIEKPKVDVSPVQIVPSSPPAPHPGNDRLTCFEIFIPVFSRRSPELNAGNDVPPVLPGAPLQVISDDRQCLPLFWFSRKSLEQTGEEERLRLPDVQNPDTEPALPGVEPGPVRTLKTPDLAPSRECLPFITSRLSLKRPEPHNPKPVPAVLERELWRDYKPSIDHTKPTAHQLYVRQFYDPLPSVSPPKGVAVLWGRPKPRGRRPRKESKPEPPEEQVKDPVIRHNPEDPKGRLGDSDGRTTTDCVDRFLPTFPWGSPVQDPDGPATNCLDLVLPTFSWGPPVEEPSRSPVIPENEPRPTAPARPPVQATKSKEHVPREEHTSPREPHADGANGNVTSIFIGHVVTKRVVVTDNGIEVVNNTTHIESLLGSDNQILSLEEIRDKSSKGTTSNSDEVSVGTSQLSADLAQRVTEGVNSLTRESQRVKETRQEPVQHGLSCSCLPFDLPRLRWSWEDHQREESVRQPLLPQDGTDNQQNVGHSTAAGVDLAVIIQDPKPVRGRDASRGDAEILKSLVYGGLDTTLISLGVVSSATGGDASTLTVLGIGLANVVFGFIIFLGTISALYKSDKPKFKQLVGPSYGINGLLAAFAYLLFGLLPPITYGFSFRHEPNRDWKMGTTCLVALVSIILLGWAKARVSAQRPATVIFTLVTTAFFAAVASYEVGDYGTRLLEKLGFHSV